MIVSDSDLSASVDLVVCCEPSWLRERCSLELRDSGIALHLLLQAAPA